MNVLILGCNGQLGRAMMRQVAAAGHAVVGRDLPEFDLCDLAAARRDTAAAKPDLIVNCTAFTAVDRCESEPDMAYAVNHEAARHAAVLAAELSARLVHFSTDYVFDGTGTRPYVESDQPCPVSVYGKSKLAGEAAVAEACERHQTLRLAWLYGLDGPNFVKTILRLARTLPAQGKPLRVVSDQLGTPTCAEDVCRQTLALAERDEYGVFHCTSQGECTWFDFARRIVERFGLEAAVEPCSTSEFPRPAPRPAYSVLENRHLRDTGCDMMPRWEQAFDAFVDACRDRLLTAEEPS